MKKYTTTIILTLIIGVLLGSQVFAQDRYKIASTREAETATRDLAYTDRVGATPCPDWGYDLIIDPEAITIDTDRAGATPCPDWGHDLIIDQETITIDTDRAGATPCPDWGYDLIMD